MAATPGSETKRATNPPEAIARSLTNATNNPEAIPGPDAGSPLPKAFGVEEASQTQTEND